VRSTAIVKSQIIDHAQFRRLLGFECFVVELFKLQATKKAFSRRIIPAIAFPAHTLLHVHYRQMLPIFPAGIRVATIRVM
jgi:hypothetical protein